jgi:hypothetical protein
MQPDPVLTVRLLEPDLDRLVPGGRDVLADVVGPDRELAMPSVDEDGELDAVSPAQLGERIERGSDGAPRVEDVVDKDDVTTWAGTSVCFGSLGPRSSRSSRWVATSSSPTGTVMPSNCSMVAASHRAR